MKSHLAYYDEYYTHDEIMLLADKDVTDKPNPPKGPLAQRNNRDSGYTDYKEGKGYIKARDIIPLYIPAGSHLSQGWVCTDEDVAEAHELEAQILREESKGDDKNYIKNKLRTEGQQGSQRCIDTYKLRRGAVDPNNTEKKNRCQQ